MKRKLKLPTNLSPELKNIQAQTNNAYESLCEVEIKMIDYLEKIIDHQRSVSECIIQIEASLLEIPKEKLALDKNLEKFGLPPLKPKPAKRTALTLSK